MHMYATPFENKMSEMAIMCSRIFICRWNNSDRMNIDVNASKYHMRTKFFQCEASDLFCSRLEIRRLELERIIDAEFRIGVHPPCDDPLTPAHTVPTWTRYPFFSNQVQDQTSSPFDTAYVGPLTTPHTNSKGSCFVLTPFALDVPSKAWSVDSSSCPRQYKDTCRKIKS